MDPKRAHLVTAIQQAMVAARACNDAMTHPARISVRIAAKIIVFRHGQRSLEFAQRMKQLSKRPQFADAVLAEVARMVLAANR